MLNSISRVVETRPEQGWLNRTVLFQFSGILGQSRAREVHPKIRKMSVPFAPHPGNSGILGRMESAGVYPVYQ